MEASTATPATRDPLDKVEVEAAVLAIYDEHGYMSDNGEIDKDAFRGAIYDVVRPAVATGRKDRASVAVLKGTIVSKVFPKAPGAEPGSTNDLDEFGQKVWEKLELAVWGALRPSARSGPIQKMLADRKTGLVLVRDKIATEHAKLDAAYCTADEDLILDLSMGPLQRKAVSNAEELGFQSQAIIQRLPNLEKPISKAATSTTREISKSVKTYLELSPAAAPDSAEATA